MIWIQDQPSMALLSNTLRALMTPKRCFQVSLNAFQIDMQVTSAREKLQFSPDEGKWSSKCEWKPSSSFFCAQFCIQRTRTGSNLLPFRSAINALKFRPLFLNLVALDGALGSIFPSTCVSVYALTCIEAKSEKGKNFSKNIDFRGTN